MWYPRGLKEETRSNLWYRKARRRDLALIPVVDTGLRSEDLSRLGSRVCGGEKAPFRFIAIGPLKVHTHARAYIHQRFFKGRKKGQLAKKSEARLKGARVRGEGEKGGEEGLSEGKEKEKVTRGIHTVNFVAPLSIPRDRGTASCILFISPAKRGERCDRFEPALRPRRTCSSKLYKTRLHASAMRLLSL